MPLDPIPVTADEVLDKGYDDIDAKEVIRQLTSLGVSKQLIATAANVPISKVEEIVTIQSTRLTPGDALLAEKVRRLADKVLGEADLIMDYGPMEQKLKIMSMVIPNVARLLGQETNRGVTEVRRELDSLYGAMRQTGTANASTHAPLESANDQNEEARTQAPQLDRRR